MRPIRTDLTLNVSPLCLSLSPQAPASAPGRLTACYGGGGLGFSVRAPKKRGPEHPAGPPPPWTCSRLWLAPPFFLAHLLSSTSPSLSLFLATLALDLPGSSSAVDSDAYDRDNDTTKHRSSDTGTHATDTSLGGKIVNAIRGDRNA